MVLNPLRGISAGWYSGPLDASTLLEKSLKTTAGEGVLSLLLFLEVS